MVLFAETSGTTERSKHEIGWQTKIDDSIWERKAERLASLKSCKSFLDELKFSRVCIHSLDASTVKASRSIARNRGASMVYDGNRRFSNRRFLT